jgi:hypothetical protein
MKIVILDGHALNPGDLSWDALRGLGDIALMRAIISSAVPVSVLPRTIGSSRYFSSPGRSAHRQFSRETRKYGLI